MIKRLFCYTGALYSWGSEPMALGRSGAITHPAALPSFPENTVKKCVFGNNHAAIVDSSGKVFTFGNGEHGMLGHDSESRQKSPKPIEKLNEIDVKIKDVAVGEYHTVLLSEEGDVWTMGYGGQLKGGLLRKIFSQGGGALGHGDLSDKFVPTPIENLREQEELVKIAAGAYHSLALGTSGQLYVWGKGEYGVMGIGKNQSCLSPVINPFFATMKKDEKVKIKDFAACAFYSAVLLEDGRVFTWGRNDEGQLGIGTSIGMDMYESEKWPIQVTHELEDKKVLQVALGERMCVFLTDQNEIYVTGMKFWWTPHKMKLPKGEITSIFASGKFAGYVVDNKDVYFVGSLFTRKEVEEVIELKLWKVKSQVFGDRKIEKIGGSNKNFYCFLNE